MSVMLVGVHANFGPLPAMKRKKVFLAIADFPLRDAILEIVQQEPAFQVVAETAPHKFIQEEIEQVMPDLLVLEITPEFRFSPLEGLSFQLPIIFLAGNEQDALQALTYQTVDYLMPHSRLSDIRRAFIKYTQWKNLFMHYFLKETMPLTIQYPKKIFVENGQKRRVLDVSTILYLKAEGDYTRIHCVDNDQYLSSFGISELEKRLDPAQFIRIHRSYIINAEFINELYRDISKTYVLLKNEVELSIGRMYLPNLKVLLF